MNIHATVFDVTPSFEDGRPTIDFQNRRNRSNNWGLVNDVLLGHRPPLDYEPPNIICHDSATAQWDFFDVPGTLGAISENAVNRIGISVFQLFRLFEVFINKRKHYFMTELKTLDCLNRDESDLVFFRSNPQRVKAINRYSFYYDRIPEHMLFSIPEFSCLLTTEGVRDSVARHQLQGFRFTALLTSA